MSDEQEAPVDRDLPAVEALLGPGRHELVRAMARELGWKSDALSVSQVRYRPGKSIVVQYRVGVAGDQRRSETLVAASGEEPAGDTPILSDGELSIGFWAFPHDPGLPGLGIAADPGRVDGLLDQVGVKTRGGIKVRIRAYRPGRRAVVEVQAPPHRVFLKVVRPHRIEHLQRLHASLSGRVPVPQTLGWSPDQGIVVLEGLAGLPLRRELEAGGGGPSSAALLRLLDAIPDIGTDSVVRGPALRAETHRHLLGAVLPDERPRLDSIVAAVRDRPVAEPVPVHGDFHSSQILVSGSELKGLIDIDTTGRGERPDDLAVLLGHLSTVALLAPSPSPFTRLGTGLIRGFDALVDPPDLRLRTAAAVFGFATGPFRVQMRSWQAETRRRLDLAERWIESAS